MKVLVTGATGYIGGRLIKPLLEKGHEVYVLTRKPERIEGQEWAKDISGVIKGDLLEKGGEWREQLEGFDVAYYLVHSLYAGAGFHEMDKQCARNFGEAGKGRIKHVVYLGGLIPHYETISEHLRSRAETGDILREYFDVTEFQAGPIIGSGSAPFEMVRYLTERIPIMVTPKWIKNKVQPIAIRDVLKYLVGAADKEALGKVEIGSDQLSFKEMMQEYARIRGLKRRIFALPVLTPNLAGRWVGLVTPIPNSVAVPLIEGVIHPVVADTKKAQEHFPEVKPISYSEAVKLALAKIKEKVVETHWSKGLKGKEAYRLTDKEGLMKEEQVRHSKASEEEVYEALAEIVGETGWPTMNWAWQIRGWLDKVIGGPGLIRDQFTKELKVGDIVDFWRVEKIEKGKELILRAEMKLPGKAWLCFWIEAENGGSTIKQTAYFEPLGLWGTIYWYSMYPMHKVIFPSMIRSIVKKAEERKRVELT